MKLIIITAGSELGLGSGHFTRMQDLVSLLKFQFKTDIGQNLALPLKRALQQISTPSKRNTSFFKIKEAPDAFKVVQKHQGKENKIFLIDLRDVDPRPFLQEGTVLCLDNQHRIRTSLEKRHSGSNRIIFHDTLPHPKIKLEKVLRQALISPLLLSLKKQKKKHPKQEGDKEHKKKILFYVGPFISLPKLKDLLNFLCLMKPFERNRNASKCDKNPFQGIEMLWFGSKARERNLLPYLSFIKRTSRELFFRHLQEASLVFCYPGMTLLEACFLAKVPVLLQTESKIHNRLSMYLQETAGVHYISNALPMTHHQQVLTNAWNSSSHSLEVTGDGYTILLQELQELGFA